MSRLGSMMRHSSNIVSVPMMDRIPIARTPVTSGSDYNRATGGAYTRLTGCIYMKRYFIIQTILWDIRNGGTYTCDFLTSGAGSTSEFNVRTATVYTGNAEETITPSNGDFLMIPGTYYLSLLCSGSTTWWDYNADWHYYSEFWLYHTWYNGGGYSYSLPIKFQGYYLEADCNLGRYSKA